MNRHASTYRVRRLTVSWEISCFPACTGDDSSVTTDSSSVGVCWSGVFHEQHSSSSEVVTEIRVSTATLSMVITEGGCLNQCTLKTESYLSLSLFFVHLRRYFVAGKRILRA